MAGKHEQTGKLAEMNSPTEQLMHREMSQLLETQEAFTPIKRVHCLRTHPSKVKRQTGYDRFTGSYLPHTTC